MKAVKDAARLVNEKDSVPERSLCNAKDCKCNN